MSEIPAPKKRGGPRKIVGPEVLRQPEPKRIKLSSSKVKISAKNLESTA